MPNRRSKEPRALSSYFFSSDFIRFVSARRAGESNIVYLEDVRKSRPREEKQ